ncbi:MAG TPA: outer membrane beta-barrel protein [Longimicrobium sp.]|jgi:opacity protein-like surface antigen
MQNLFRMFAAAAVLTVAASAAQAQATGGTGVSFSGGTMNYDLSGTGNTPALALRADFPLASVFRLEAGVVAARPDQQFGDDPTFIIPEVQLQAQLPLGRVAPYVGAGIGMTRQFESEVGSNSDVAFSAGAGARVALAQRLAGIVDGRVHAIGSGFTGTTAELSVGLRWRMGGSSAPTASASRALPAPR